MTSVAKKHGGAAPAQKTAEPPPATPRKRVAQARNLATTSASIRDAIAGCVGKALNVFALAEIAVLQRDSDFREEPQMFDNEADAAPERPWQTFENLIADDPDKAVTAPVTVSTDVKMGLTALFIGVADLVNEVGKLPAVRPLDRLAAAPTREANVVQLMVAVTAQMRPHLRADPMSRDLNYPMVFRQKLEALVASKTLVDPGAADIARLFLDFLKVVAWHAGVLAYEHEHLTLNRATLYSILAQMAASVPEGDAPVVRDVLGFVRNQVENWETAVAHTKAAKAKKAPAKAAAKPAPKAAAKPAPKADAPAPKGGPEAPPPADETDAPAPVEAPPPAEGASPAVAPKAAPKKAPAPELDYDALLDDLQGEQAAADEADEGM